MMGLTTYGVSRLGGGDEQGSPETDTPEATGLRRLREQVRELEASVAHSERAAREAQSAAQAAQVAVRAQGEKPSSAPPAPEANPPARGPDAPPPEPRVEEVIEQLDERFFTELLDPGWSQQARRRADQFTGLLPTGARVLSLECRTSICRMETAQPSLEAFQDFVRQRLVGGNHDWDGPIMAAVKGDPHKPGEIVTVTYLAREGADLSPEPRE